MPGKPIALSARKKCVQSHAETFGKLRSRIHHLEGLHTQHVIDVARHILNDPESELNATARLSRDGTALLVTIRLE